jgi:hypothetical protein
MNRKKLIVGWVAVAITVIISGIWAYWGANENFHEGWYSESVWENLFMLFFQYLIFAIIFTVLAVVILKWKLAGLILHILVAGFCIWFFNRSSFSVIGILIIIPFATLALLYWFGEPAPKKLAYGLIVGVPLVMILVISIPLGIKVSKRIDTGDLSSQTVEGNGVLLTWAPRGPGWPDEGVSWEEANDICAHLSEDGLTVMEEEQNIWRLPSVDEAVRSMMLHGVNAGGIWDEDGETAVYQIDPDKESPLWDVHSKVIYYWTADTSKQNDEQAYIIVYHGGVYDKYKTDSQDYLSFRAVKNAEAP